MRTLKRVVTCAHSNACSHMRTLKCEYSQVRTLKHEWSRARNECGGTWLYAFKCVVTCVHWNVGVVTVRAQTCVVTCLYSNVGVVTCTYSNEGVVVCAQIKRGRRPVCALKRECYHGCNGRWATASAGAEMFVLCIVELGERALLIKCDNRCPAEKDKLLRDFIWILIITLLFVSMS